MGVSHLKRRTLTFPRQRTANASFVGIRSRMIPGHRRRRRMVRRRLQREIRCYRSVATTRKSERRIVGENVRRRVVILGERRRQHRRRVGIHRGVARVWRRGRRRLLGGKVRDRAQIAFESERLIRYETVRDVRAHAMEGGLFGSELRGALQKHTKHVRETIT